MIWVYSKWSKLHKYVLKLIICLSANTRLVHMKANISRLCMSTLISNLVDHHIWTSPMSGQFPAEIVTVSALHDLNILTQKRVCRTIRRSSW